MTNRRRTDLSWGFVAAAAAVVLGGFFAAQTPAQQDDLSGQQPQQPISCGSTTGAHRQGCQQGIHQGYIHADEAAHQPPGGDGRANEMVSDFHTANPHANIDPAAFDRAVSGLRPPLSRGDAFGGVCGALAGCPSSGTPDQQYDFLAGQGLTSLTHEEYVSRSDQPMTTGEFASVLYRLDVSHYVAPYSAPAHVVVPPVTVTHRPGRLSFGHQCYAVGLYIYSDPYSGNICVDGGLHTVDPYPLSIFRCWPGWQLGTYAVPGSNGAIRRFTCTPLPPPPPTTTTAPLHLSNDRGVTIDGDSTVGESDGYATFSIRLHRSNSREVTVRVSTSEVTTTRYSDYVPFRDHLVTFPAGGSAWSGIEMRVPILEDPTVEPDETFRLELADPSSDGRLISPSAMVVTIVDDDDAAVSITGPSGPTAEDTGSAANTVAFTVALDVAHFQPVTVTAATASGTATGGACATPGVDYITKTQTLTFNPGEVSKPFVVTFCLDAVHEPDETFDVTISGPSNAGLGAATTATATIRDNDAPPVLVSISDSPTEEEGDSLAFRVTLDITPTAAVSVSFRVADAYYRGHPLYLDEGTFCGSSPTTDYAAPSSTTLTWAAGAYRFQTVRIRTCDDRIDEQDKTLTVELHTPSGAAIDVGSASGTITDNDDPSPYPTVTDPTFFVNSPTVEEGGELEFVVTFMPLGTSWEGALTMMFSGSATLSAAGTECAAVGDDAHINRRFTTSQDTYTRNKSSRASWVGGEVVRLVLYTCDDTTPEALETITAALSTTPGRSATAAAVGPDGVGTIIDNDNPEAYLTGPVSVTEGNPLDFEVRLRAAAPEDVTVTVSTADDPAAVHLASAIGARRDYLPKTDYQVVVPAGSLSTTVLVFTSGDTADEYDETMLLRITAASSAVGGVVGSPAEAVGTIVDNDNPPEIWIGDVIGFETGVLTFDVSLSVASRKTVTVTASTAASSPLSAAATAACSAVDGSEDYQTRSSLITYPPGTGSASFEVTVCDDTASESDETFTVTLSAVANATINATYGTATGTIVDDDRIVTLPVYVSPPAAPECPTLWHEHGFDCVPDHTVPVVCGTSAHAYQAHDINDPHTHHALTHPACVTASDVCSAGFHDHAGTCVSTHRDPPLPCRANRRLVWQSTVHTQAIGLACPDPVVDIDLLVNTAGGSMTLSFSVDVTSGHVEPTRTFTITAVDGTAVNGTHYTMTTPVTATFDAVTQTYEVSIPTIARQDHGPDPLRFTITVADTHPLRGHVTSTMTAAINPPAIERQ